jgi:hypothetical protein
VQKQPKPHKTKKTEVPNMTLPDDEPKLEELTLEYRQASLEWDSGSTIGNGTL